MRITETKIAASIASATTSAHQSPANTSTTATTGRKISINRHIQRRQLLIFFSPSASASVILTRMDRSLEESANCFPYSSY